MDLGFGRKPEMPLTPEELSRNSRWYKECPELDDIIMDCWDGVLRVGGVSMKLPTVPIAVRNCIKGHYYALGEDGLEYEIDLTNRRILGQKPAESLEEWLDDQATDSTGSSDLIPGPQEDEPSAYAIAKRIVGNEGNFQIGFVTQCLGGNERLQKLLEDKEKQIFKEIWEIMTPEERKALDAQIKIDFPNEVTDLSYWENELEQINAEIQRLELSNSENGDALALAREEKALYERRLAEAKLGPELASKMTF